MLGRGSGGDKGRGLVPIHVGSRHLIRVLEAEARKLERAPLNRQVIVAGALRETGERLRVELRPLAAHEGTSRSIAKASRRERSDCESGRSPIMRSSVARIAFPSIFSYRSIRKNHFYCTRQLAEASPDLHHR